MFYKITEKRNFQNVKSIRNFEEFNIYREYDGDVDTWC